MKTTGIIAFISAAFVWIRKIVKSASKLKKVKKEVLEAHAEIDDVVKKTKPAYEEIKSFFTEDSDGGKKLTAKELKRGTELIEMVYTEGIEAVKETLEAKDSIKEFIDEFRNK